MNQSFNFLFILGPTGSGKSALALKLATQVKAGIVNLDSIQCYAQVDIGSAKPSEEEVKLCPHYLFGYVRPPEEITAGKFKAKARNLIDQEIRKSSLIGVGGSGFYVKALMTQMRSRHELSPELLSQLEERAQSEGLYSLYEEMVRLDPKLKGKIHPNDSYRVVRNLGLMLETGLKVSSLEPEEEKDWPHPYKKVGLHVDRDLLRRRVRDRLLSMLKRGFREEVQALLDQGLADWLPMKSVGYKEMQEWIEGRISQAEFIDKTVISTMQLAKRQMTWLKKDKEILWFSGDHLEAKAFEVCESWLKPSSSNKN